MTSYRTAGDLVFTMAQITSSQDNPVLEHDGYLYGFVKDAAAGDGKFWRCLRDGCNGRVKTDSNDVFVEVRNVNHNHVPSPEEMQVCRIVTSIEERAETESGVW